MSNEIKIGIFGADRGRAFYEPINDLEGAKIVAVCDMSEDMLKESTYDEIGKSLPEDCKVFSNFDEFIDSGIDAVILCNFFHEHAKYAIKALDKGIAVMSDTTAAPTMKQCVELCEAVERNNGKYMLGANVPYMYGMQELQRLYYLGEYGAVKFAEAEYLHYDDPNAKMTGNAPLEHHWRKYLPMTYYNMHTLGPLMFITGEVPEKVNARAVPAGDMPQRKGNKVKDAVAYSMCKTNNGAIFVTTACAHLGPNGKWFRLNCDQGCMETARENKDVVVLSRMPWKLKKGDPWYQRYSAKPENLNEVEKNATHDGSDYRLVKAFIEYLNGGKKPFFDVYRSVALSAAGILGWYSALEDGATYDIPDFKDKKARAKWADDDRTPFPDLEGNGATLPCSVH